MIGGLLLNYLFGIIARRIFAADLAFTEKPTGHLIIGHLPRKRRAHLTI